MKDQAIETDIWKDEEEEIEDDMFDQNEFSHCLPLNFGNNSQDNPIVIAEGTAQKVEERDSKPLDKYVDLLKNRKCLSQFSDMQLLHIIHPYQIRRQAGKVLKDRISEFMKHPVFANFKGNFSHTHLSKIYKFFNVDGLLYTKRVNPPKLEISDSWLSKIGNEMESKNKEKESEFVEIE